MRKTFIALSAAGALLISAPAMAQKRNYNPYAPAAVGAGAVVGTTMGLAQYNSWWGLNTFPKNSALGTGLESSVAGSLATGFVTGVATVAFIDAATQPCRGFRAFFAPFYGTQPPRGCRSGEYVG